MKTAIVTALAIAAASPVLASDQLALSLGVEPGQYSLEELVVIKAQSEATGNEGRVYLDNLRDFSERSVHNPVALRQFEQSAEESD